MNPLNLLNPITEKVFELIGVLCVRRIWCFNSPVLRQV
jgi:hypothetical protein